MNDKEKLKQIAIEMTEFYSLTTKTNYDVNLEQDIYEIIKNREE